MQFQAAVHSATPHTHRSSMPVGTRSAQHTMLTVARSFVPGWPRPRRPAPITVGLNTLSISINCRFSVYRRVRYVRFAEFLFTGTIDFGFLRRFPALPSRAIGPGHWKAARPSRVDSVARKL